MTGLAPLWATRSAAWLSLGIATALVLLNNAVYKDGAELATTPMLLRLSARLAALSLSLLVVLAGYGLYLRVAQYGLTPRRVWGGAWLIMMAGYAVGYAWALFDRILSLRRLAPVNVGQAWLLLLLLIAVGTPLADPDRLAVNQQVNRLLDGRVRADHFDFGFLRANAAIYGPRALLRLEHIQGVADAALIHAKSQQAAAWQQPRNDHSNLAQPVDYRRNLLPA